MNESGIGNFQFDNFSTVSMRKQLSWPHLKSWEDGLIPPDEFRRLLVQWTQETWAVFHADGGQKQVLDTFQRCGLLNACDGSEDKLIKVPGVVDYSIDEPDNDDDKD